MPLGAPAASPAGFPEPVRAALDRRLDRNSTAPIAVAFSGGGDSLALLLAASAWAQGSGRPVVALTVDHELQAQSAIWTDMARRTAEGLGVGFRALQWKGPKPAEGLPAAARLARHALLAAAARDISARAILLGHTLDDILEAELMRAEGCTVGVPREWSPSPAWPEGRGLFLLRPLLAVRRAALRQILSASGLSWIDDPANDDSRFARTRARQSLTLGRGPAISFRPQSDDVDLRDLAAAADVDAFGVIVIDRRVLANAPAAAARRFLATACVCAGGRTRLPRSEQVQRLLGQVLEGGAGAATLASARIEWGHRVQFMRSAGDLMGAAAGPVPIAVGRPVVWDGRFELTAVQAGLQAWPLRGKVRRLPADQRRGLKTCPAAARPSLPAVNVDGESVTCPILADGAQTRARSLVGDRLLDACGAVARESFVEPCPHGEPEVSALS